MADKSLKDSWADFGKGMGKSMAGLGKAIIKSAKVGLDKADGTAADGSGDDLKKSWSDVGHSFGKTGASLGKAAKKTIDTVADSDKPEQSETELNDTKTDNQ